MNFLISKIDGKVYPRTLDKHCEDLLNGDYFAIIQTREEWERQDVLSDETINRIVELYKEWFCEQSDTPILDYIRTHYKK